MKIKEALIASALIAAAPFPVSAARGVAVSATAAPSRSAKSAASDCSDMSLRVALAKARAEMSAILPGSNGDAAAFEGAMNSDADFNERVKGAFGNADLIKSEYSRGGGCVVTVQLSLAALQGLSGARKAVN
jgi:hypothetical protein